jgi:hypothetical protein
MSRGRPPARALALATGIAEKRGGVQYFQQASGLICNFVIYLACLVAHVRVMRVRHLRCTLAWLEREVADALAGLRMIASSPAISRELWICSPRGLFRCFRVCDDGLVELDRDGKQRPVQASFSERKKGPAAPGTTGRTGGGLTAAASPASPATVPVVTLPNRVPATGVSVGEHLLPDHRGGAGV